MTCIFLPKEELTSNKIIIKGEQAKHLSVLRIKSGEIIKIFDGIGHRYISKVIKSHRKEVLLEILKEEAYSAESPLSIVLAQGIPKRDKMDFIVQKSTELGVKKIIPIITERAEVRETGKLERWKKIALSASQQSGREKIPDIEEPVSFKKFLSTFSRMSLRVPTHRDEAISKGEILLPKCRHQNDICKSIIFSEEEKTQDLKKVLKNLEGAATITLLIGPEGGFSPAELTMAVNKGFIPASLGPRILRTETAAITAISIIQYELGDMG